jgi:hypothetical protein
MSAEPSPLPADLDAERALLSSVLLEPKIFPDLDVRAEDFHHPAHGTIWRGFQSLRAGVKAIDLVTITGHLADSNQLGNIGGPSYLAGLQTFISTALNAQGYADTVRIKSRTRQAISTTERALRDLYAPGADIGSVLGGAIAQLSPIRAEYSESRGNSLTFRSVSEILGMTFSDSDLYLSNGYLQKGGSLAIAGSGGIGKSRLVMQLAICSAAGIPFLGWPTRGNPKWLFLQTENGNRRLHHDLAKMTKSLGAEEIALLDRKIVFHTLENSHDVLIRPSSDKAHNRLADAITRHDPDVVVFDVLRDFAIGDLNSDDGMSQTLDAIGQLARHGRSDRSVVIVHHARTGKVAAAGAFGIDRANFARNSKVLLGWARAVLNIAPLSEDDPELIGIASGKNNDFREIDPLALRLNPDRMLYVPDRTVDVAAKVAALSETGKKASSVTSDAVVEIVESVHPSGISRTELSRRVMEKGCGRSKSYDLIADAETQKRIKFSGKMGGFLSAQKSNDFSLNES